MPKSGKKPRAAVFAEQNLRDMIGCEAVIINWGCCDGYNGYIGLSGWRCRNGINGRRVYSRGSQVKASPALSCRAGGIRYKEVLRLLRESFHHPIR